MKYDVVIVGSGLYGATWAYLAARANMRCLVLERRSHIGGNVYTEEIESIHVHRYGAHIFHTNDKEVWNFIQQFGEFNHYINSPLAYYKGKIYNLPFNMNTFYQMWGVVRPEEAKAIIEAQRKDHYVEYPSNLEEQAINLVGVDIYEKLIKGYTEKQWGRPCTELPPDIIKRLPVRFIYDNNYFDSRYQGIPVDGYTAIIKKMLQGTDVLLNTDFLSDPEYWKRHASLVVYAGPIDAYFNYEFGPLEYRSLCFETEILDIPNYQGNAVVNYTDRDVPYTRIIEHKHFVFGKQPKTVITREYSQPWEIGKEPYYPVGDQKNVSLYQKYLTKAREETSVVFGGRLGEYRYYDMDQVIRRAMDTFYSVVK
ncbi:UDP-galactopyranose mutase [Treponema sp. J25]|uniref:UDP-galactopyranose mutase n=1 Tax=Treponema sp. J25 TaxID=2094121 RepID=UPI001044D9C4|nr:UDP-galactopyranose mutase [Treponema sp. J25]TCW61174.1 UDP-galactopyranose mutase [Treponema sp. J25]